MSADNGIYLIKFPEGYRVAHCQAIENIDYYPEGSKDRKKGLKALFGRSKVYKTRAEADIKATELALKILNDDFCPVLEYGVQYLGEYESWKKEE